jgi:hypothetical protein
VKIVILHNLPTEDHAVVAARVNGQWLILDNRRLALIHDTEMVGSIPKFVLDEDGTRRFVPPKRLGHRPSDSIELGFTNKASAIYAHDVRLR